MSDDVRNEIPAIGRRRVTLNLTADEALALAMLIEAGVSNALSDDDAAVLDRIREKLTRARGRARRPRDIMDVFRDDDAMRALGVDRAAETAAPGSTEPRDPDNDIRA